MAEWKFWDWLAYGLILLPALMICYDGTAAQIERLKTKRIFDKNWAMFVPLGCVTVSAVSFGVGAVQPIDVLLPPKSMRGFAFDVVQAWGINNGAYFEVVNTNSIQDDKSQKLVLIIRANYANIDRMTDTAILRSQLYTITSGFMSMAVISAPGIRASLDKPTPIEFSLVEIPSLFTPDQIKSLSDIENFKGKIIATVGTVVDYRTPVIPPAKTNCPAPPT